jgi:hypothetical protein
MGAYSSVCFGKQKWHRAWIAVDGLFLEAATPSKLEVRTPVFFLSFTSHMTLEILICLKPSRESGENVPIKMFFALMIRPGELFSSAGAGSELRDPQTRRSSLNRLPSVYANKYYWQTDAG